MNLAIDIETTKIPNHTPWVDGSYVVSIHLCSDSMGTKSVVLQHDSDDGLSLTYRQRLNLVQDWINSHERIIGQNFKFDLMWLRQGLGLDFGGKRFYDTMVAEYLLRGQRGQGQLNLEDLSTHYGIPPKQDLVKGYWDSGYDTNEIPLSVLIPYGEQDVINTLTIFQKQYPQIVARSMSKLIGLNMRLMDVLSTIEFNGMLLDLTLMKKLADEGEKKLAELSTTLRSCIPSDNDWNLNSNDDLSILLFGGTLLVDGYEETQRILKSGEVKIGSRRCKVPYNFSGLGFKPLEEWKASKEGFYFTNTDVIQQLKPKTTTQKLFINTLKEYNKLQKQVSTYYIGLATKCDSKAFIHPNFNQCITKTGRLSASNPNSMNIPRGSTSPAKQPFITRYPQC